MDKLQRLKEFISRYQSVVIAFSGGADSTFLACVSKEILGQHVLLVTATSSTYPFYELEEAKEIARFLALPHKIIISEEIDIPGFADNPPDRCYYCKKELFAKIKYIARQENYEVVFDGSNADDLNDYRPGMKAIREAFVISPLKELGFSKEEIRIYSRQYKLPTADKPSYACLASRFPYGERITSEKLNRIARVEWEIRKLGFTQFRVRNHEQMARLEFIDAEMDKAWVLRDQLNNICKSAGFIFVAIDLTGYKTGKMNDVFNRQRRNEA